jgi:hypothetical protein
MKAIGEADQAAGTAGIKLVERPEPQAARLAGLSGASLDVAAGAQTYAELEARVLARGMEGIALQYGFYYGPGTWFHPRLCVRRQGPAAGIPNHRRRLRRLVVGPRRGRGTRDGRYHVAR